MRKLAFCALIFLARANAFALSYESGNGSNIAFDVNQTSAAINSSFGLNISTTTNGTGTSILMLDAANGRVGVNDTTPDAALDIGGGVQFDGNGVFGNASGDSVTFNAAGVTFSNDTAVTLSGGLDGINFDANTLSIDAANNRVGIGNAAPSGTLVVDFPAAQTIAAGNTITADACGSLKLITSGGAVTTDTTNTFSAPAAGNKGCIMHTCNSGANNITLDNNANFKSAGGADVVVTADDCVTVGSSGASGVWYQLTALEAN